jgi:integrase
VAKQNFGSRFSPTYWRDRIYRPRYVRDGQRFSVTEWYARIQHAGRREQIGLGTNFREDAARRAARLYQTVRAKGWDRALKEFAPDKTQRTDCPTVGEFLTAVEQVTGLNPRTLRGYTVSLRWVTARTFGIEGSEERFDYKGDGNRKWRERIDRVSLDKLSPQRVEAAIAAFIASAGTNPLAQQKARRSGTSMARQARALFSPKLLRKLPFVSVPSPFAGVHLEGARPVRYDGTINAAALLRDGRTELAEQDPEAYKALLLALGAGLRKREIDNLTWPQIDAEQNVVRIQTTETFQAKTAGSEGAVYVDPGLIAELNQHRERATGLFVLESKLPPRPESPVSYYRAGATFDRLNVWLKSKGVLAHKPLHTLRKEFGSLINASADIYTASRQLRHSNIATTAAYYADNRRRVTVPVGAMLQNTKPALGKIER